MYKACSRCGRIHDTAYMCPIRRTYGGGEERKLRSSYKWQKKSMEIRDRAQYLCEVCRDQGTYTYKDIEVHHIAKVKDQPEKLLDNDNLICLCVEHHKLADDGKIDSEYLTRLAKAREDRKE